MLHSVLDLLREKEGTGLEAARTMIWVYMGMSENGVYPHL